MNTEPGTDDNQSASNHQRNIKRVLDESEPHFARDERSGIYYPKPHSHKDKVEGKINATPHDNRIFAARPRELASSVLTALANCLSAAISLGTLVGLIYTVKFASKQWQEMDLQTQNAARALEETKRSNADNSRENLKSYGLSRESLENVQRAFVFPSVSANPAIDPKTNRPFLITIQIKCENSGTTPAKGMLTHTSFEFGKQYPSDLYSDKWEVGAPHIATPAYISPKGSVYSNPINIPIPLVTSFADSGAHIYVWGWAKYQDVFKNTKPHVTKYCYDVTVQKDLDESGAFRSFTQNFTNCEKGNCYDDECEVK